MTMEELKIKYAPAIKDLTVGSKEPEDDEGMEAVLWEKGNKVEESKSDGRFMTHEKSEDAQLFDMIRRKDWKALMYRCQAHPHLAYVKFSRNSAMSKGNLVLHEICKHSPPIDVVETFYEANDSAVMIRGYGGYLPLHHACANGASDDVIQYLLSKYPEAVSVADENEHMLPLHLTCKVGASEDIFMLLLSHYPEAASSKDDFGRLPLDYAKNIRSAGSRDIAIKCLNFAKWLKTSSIYARRKTEKEYESRIRGYEECQAQHLKMIKEVHDEEIAELENAVLAQQKDFSTKLNLLTELQQDLKKKDKEIEKQAASLAKIQVIVGLKKVEVDELSKELAKANKRVEKMSRKLEARSSELELATQDIEILNQHSEWLETALGSIRKIANTEAPLVRSLHQREESSRDWEHSHSQGIAQVPAAKKFETAPRFGKKHVSADEGAFNNMDDDRSEDCDSELHSVTREGAE
ncbi:ankyrin repeat domain protein [Nitzschia inconspicua]|uniref:Ankyrin repeat domain protein n=1 Tax=Nitzschia inconspicua TaxID=303405 RepID=A0A9K3KJ50_9STRA|nr:ankyrin repeat domain protein [Nitzschia inconspicua]